MYCRWEDTSYRGKIFLPLSSDPVKARLSWLCSLQTNHFFMSMRVYICVCEWKPLYLHIHTLHYTELCRGFLSRYQAQNNTVGERFYDWRALWDITTTSANIHTVHSTYIHTYHAWLFTTMRDKLCIITGRNGSRCEGREDHPIYHLGSAKLQVRRPHLLLFDIKNTRQEILIWWIMKHLNPIIVRSAAKDGLGGSYAGGAEEEWS